MTLSTTPPPARTDVTSDARPTVPAREPAGSARLVRIAGAAVTTGSLAWAAGMLAYGNAPEAGTGEAVVVHLSSLLFQLGLAALVSVQLRTRATGTGRLARGFLHVEHVLLGLAMVSTLLWAFAEGMRGTPLFAALDVFWPLSMVGMAAIGVRIAVAGRWRGAARFWPMVAESWAPVVVPISVLFPALGPVVGAGHLVVGYATLGLILALRPALTGVRG